MKETIKENTTGQKGFYKANSTKIFSDTKLSEVVWVTFLQVDAILLSSWTVFSENWASVLIESSFNITPHPAVMWRLQVELCVFW